MALSLERAMTLLEVMGRAGVHMFTYTGHLLSVPLSPSYCTEVVVETYRAKSLVPYEMVSV